MNDKAIPILVEKINQYIQEQLKNEKSSTEIVTKELEKIEKQLNNIVNAIIEEFAKEELKIRMNELTDKKSKLEAKLKEQESKSKVPKITVEQVKNLFSMFREFVKKRNIPECKKFIQNYVNKVIFSVVFNILKDYKIKSSIKKSILLKKYK